MSIPRAVAVVVALLATPIARAATLDYTSWSESALVMLLWDILYPEANVVAFGESSRAGIDQYALLIADNANNTDDGQKNAVLFECGMHAREWYATESCFWLADYLINNRSDPVVQELLDQVDVWIIPQTNPAGRDNDDPGLGDPTSYTWFCNGGVKVGDDCASDADCPGVANGCYDLGWRGNTHTSACFGGVDLARNWSSGWNTASTSCTSSDFSTFRGNDPFSEPEARNLRSFVHNHMISMAAVVHANGQEVGHHWASSSSAAAWIQDELWSQNDSAVAAWGDPDVALAEHATGAGVGQFSGWLTGTSDVGGELDEGTQRNIPVVFFELPISNSFYAPPYQEVAGDGSNGFHPSGDDMEPLYEDTLRSLFLEVIRQARSPACPVDASGVRVTSECPSDDFGLAGAKIADDIATPGVLSVDASTREETLARGTHRIVFAAQNFSASGATTSTGATVTVMKDGVLAATYNQTVTLAGGARAVYSFSHNFTAVGSSSDYFVTIALDGDGFSKNNVKSFAFRVDPAFIFQAYPFPGKATIHIDPEPLKPITLSSTHPMDVPDPSLFDPTRSGVDVTFRAYRPGLGDADYKKTVHIPNTGWTRIPNGWSWGVGRQGPVSSIRIRNVPATPTQPATVNVDLKAKSAIADGMRNATAWTVDLAFPGKGALRAVATNDRLVYQPPHRGNPDPSEDEQEP